MTIFTRLQQAALSPLAQQFSRFCAELDSNASELALATAALLAEHNSHGDTCLELRSLAGESLLKDENNTCLLTAPDHETWKKALACTFVGKPGDYQPLILDAERLYLHRHWREEQIITQALNNRYGRLDFDAAKLKQRLDKLFKKLSPDDHAYSQKLAAAMALSRHLTIITGGPGTGKTTTVTKILALLLEQQTELRIRLAAPTGKAAARLVESIGKQIAQLSKQIDNQILDKLPREASTIHRLLGWQRNGFQHNADNPLPCDCLLLDEFSMVDQGLMASLLTALPEHCRIILLGDRDQLSSVEAGSVLGDLTGHGRKLYISNLRAKELSSLIDELPADLVAEEIPAIADHIAQLTHSYRFTSGGGIGQLANAVNTGNADAVIELLNQPNDQLSWIEAIGKQPGQSVIDWAVEHYKPIFAAANAKEALKIFESVRVLTALREGSWGEIAIRERLETRLKNDGLIDNKDDSPSKGLPLIIRRNDRETGLFNGDTGIFWPDDNGMIMAWFPSSGENTDLDPFSLHQLPEWQPAWALTVHRSQGSEYAKVLLLLPPLDSVVVSRELIYTGITRAVNHCTIVAVKTQFSQSIKYQVKRLSGLSERIGWPEKKQN
ncbi:MAG: exodeoxyribonuclease V subunit alpha [Gammaproteobacteria bacterium]|nr:exodeoxyribonuclease V subunit alpha [Gammaproteobacteria bacterium]